MVYPSHPFLIMSSVSLSMNEDEEEVHDDNEELEDEEEVHDDSEEDDHHEVESNIEVDGDNDNNMQPKFYKPPSFNSKKRKLRHSLSEGVAENHNNARSYSASCFNTRSPA